MSFGVRPPVGSASRAACIIARPPERVHVEHPDAERCRRTACGCDRIRNVVEFEIEEDAEAAPDSGSTSAGPAAVKSSLPTFTLHCAGSRRCARSSADFRVAEIERDDDAGIRLLTPGTPFLFRAARRVGLPRRARGTVPVVLPRAEAAVVAFVHGEALRVLVHERLDELEIAPALDRRLEQLRLEQLVEPEQRRRAAQLVAHQPVSGLRPLLARASPGTPRSARRATDISRGRRAAG